MKRKLGGTAPLPVKKSLKATSISTAKSTLSLARDIEDDVRALFKDHGNTLKQGELREKCKPYADEHTDVALEHVGFSLGDAKKLLKTVRQQVTSSMCDDDDWFGYCQILLALEYWHDSNLSGGGGGGWDAKLFKKMKTLCSGKKKANWPDNFAFFVIGSRTDTYYGYRFPGKQGPHTIARILGVRSRRHRVRAHLKLIKMSKFEAYGCKDTKSIAVVHAMYKPYLSIPSEIQKLVKTWPKWTFKYSQLDYEKEHAKITTTLAARSAFKKHFGLDYSPQKHALIAYDFYLRCYHLAYKKGDLIMMMGLGQILADLHPLSTVTTKSMASHSDTKAGGEGGSIRTLGRHVAKGDLNGVIKAIKGSGSNKGLVDTTSIKSWDLTWQKLFEIYKRRVFTAILDNYGFHKTTVRDKKIKSL